MLAENELTNALATLLVAGIAIDGSIDENELGTAAAFYSGMAGGTEDDIEQAVDILSATFDQMSGIAQEDMKETILGAMEIVGSAFEKNELKDFIGFVKTCQGDDVDEKDKQFLNMLKKNWAV